MKIDEKYIWLEEANEEINEQKSSQDNVLISRWEMEFSCSTKMIKQFYLNFLDLSA